HRRRSCAAHSRARETSGDLRRSFDLRGPSGSSAPGDVPFLGGEGPNGRCCPRLATPCRTFAAPAVRRPVLRPSGDPWFACGPRGLPAPSGGGPPTGRSRDRPGRVAGSGLATLLGPGDPTRLSDLAASLPCRVPGRTVSIRSVSPPLGRLRCLVRSLLLAFQPLGAMRNVPTAPGR